MNSVRVPKMTDLALIEELKTLVDAGKVLTDADSLNAYGKDWTKHFAPAPTAIVFPKTTEQVQAIVLWANKHKVALVPSGGRTGRSEEHTSELQSRENLVCRLLLEKQH